MYRKKVEKIGLLIMACLLIGVFFLSNTSGAANKNYDSKIPSVKNKITVSAENFSALNGCELYSSKDSFSYENGVLHVTSNDSFKIIADVPSEGEYHLFVDYYFPNETMQNFLLSIDANGEEVNPKAVLQSLWKDKTNKYRTDEYGNDVVPGSVRVYEWQTQALSDIKTNMPDIYKMKQGENEIEISILQGEALIGDIMLVSTSEIPSYEMYMQEYPSTYIDAYTGETLEGEHFTYKSKAEIRGRRSRNSDLEPYDASRLTISTLSGETWSTPGDFVVYEFDVQESGLYFISFKYLLDNTGDFPVYKNIYLDEEILFNELQNYIFPQSGSKYANHTISANGNESLFYLEKGSHSIKIESTAALFKNVYSEIANIVAEMDALALDIKIIRGNQTDAMRDWDIESFIPDIEERVKDLIRRLENANKLLCEITGEDELSAASSLLIAADEYEKVLEKRNGLDDLVTNVEQFAQGSGSLAERITNFLNDMLEQPMSIDRIYILPADEGMEDVEKQLPKAKKGFFISAIEQIKQLVLSVFFEEDETNTLDKNKLNVWVIRSTAHVEEMRQLAADFTSKTGIEVNISSVLDEQKILLALASGDIPDVVCGGGLSKPYDLALRGAVTDLEQFEDFDEVAKWYDSEMFVPFIYEGGCYAIPESVNPWITYYRTDIFEKLELEPPKTYDELIDILPVLYANGMSVSTLLSNSASLKPMLSMYPYIQQNGAELYTQDGLSINFLQNDFSEYFVELTELYTKYSLPHTVSSFYVNFRDGISPIGIADMGTYMLLKNSSPDLEGRWAITDTIGVQNNDGTISNTMPLVANGCYILKDSNKQDDAWKFLKWWQSSETQAEFSMNLQRAYGEAMIWVPANKQSLQIYFPFSEVEQEVILNRFNNIAEIPLHPAHMLVERALSDAWNDAVINGVDPLTSLNYAHINATRDITKKLKEFGYISENGSIIQNYSIPKKQQVGQ